MYVTGIRGRLYTYIHNIYKYILLYTRFEETLQLESEELVINRSSRLKRQHRTRVHNRARCP